MNLGFSPGTGHSVSWDVLFTPVAGNRSIDVPLIGQRLLILITQRLFFSQ